MGSEEIEEAAREIEQRWRWYYEKAAKPLRCIYCGDIRVNFNGSRKRSASILVLTVVVYVAQLLCRRVKCAACGKSWTLRPPDLMPHKHFQLCVVAQALGQYLFEPDGTLSRVALEHGCSRRTVKRWVVWTASIAEPATLVRETVEAADAPLVPRLCAVEQLGRKAYGILGQLLERAAEVLGLMESLCSGWRLEPPGLRAVVRQVLGERSGVGTYARPVIPELARCAG